MYSLAMYDRGGFRFVVATRWESPEDVTRIEGFFGARFVKWVNP